MDDLHRSRREAHRSGARLAAAVMAALALIAVLFGLAGCGGEEEEMVEEQIPDTSEESYGVFIGVDASSFDISLFEGYDLVVVDAQELKSEQLVQLHARGHTVYSYLNVGSIEKTRDYYRDYRDLCLDRYDNWPDEYWVDVTQDKWQDFVTEDLPAEILRKDPEIDGLFLDNLDVYAHIQETRRYRKKSEETFAALTGILEAYAGKNLPVLINGADAFVSRMIEEGREDLIGGINQETVFSAILDYDRDKFGEQDEDDLKYYKTYLKTCKKAGIEVFLLEYTTDTELEETIVRYCEKNGYRYYISAHVNLIPYEE